MALLVSGVSLVHFSLKENIFMEQTRTFFYLGFSLVVVFTSDRVPFR